MIIRNLNNKEVFVFVAWRHFKISWRPKCQTFLCIVKDLRPEDLELCRYVNF